MQTPGNCPVCKGHRLIAVQFGGTRRCGTCKGTGNAPVQVVRTFAAREAVFAELDKAPARDKWDGRSAFGHLQGNAPDRFAKLLNSVEGGRAADVAACLVRYYRDLYPE